MQPTSTLPIGIIHNPNHHKHSTPSHPEAPKRLDSILERFNTFEFIKNCVLITDFPPTPEPITLIHNAKYIQMVKGLKNMSRDSYSTPDTHQVAELAASGACLAVDKIFTNQFRHAFCLVRPPGHHANTLADCLTGFCVFNNVAVAAEHARTQYKLKKILIFDWDVHHGDSTQKIFEKDPNILFISLHKYQQGGFFPGRSGSMMNTGKEEGQGYNINCAWDVGDQAGCCRTVGDNEYVYAVESVMMPIIRSFEPELIFISAGFDAANGDPLGGLSISPFGYSYMVKRLLSFERNVIVCLEGGYNPEVNAISAEYCMRTLLNEEVPLKDGPKRWTMENMKENCLPNRVGVDTVERLVLTFAKFWPVLNENEASSYRNKIKDNLKRFYSEDRVLCSSLSAVMIKNILCKEHKPGEHLILKQASNEKSWVAESLKGVREYLPVPKAYRVREGMKLSLYDLGLKRFEKCSYFILRIGDSGIDGDEEIYQNKNGRLLKMVWRDEENQIVHKWDQEANYGVNYDMKIDDWNHDRFILFMKYFLESHGRSEANVDAFKYFRGFVEKLDDWLSGKTRITFSSMSIGFFVNNLKNQYRACVLDLSNVEVEKEDKDHNAVVSQMIKEMRKVLWDDEGFIYSD